MLMALSSKRAFCYALLAVTLAPMAFFILLGARADIGGVAATKWLLMLLGSAHVPATLVFYADPAFRRIVAANPWRYARVPILLTVGSGLVFAASSALAQGLFQCGFWLWLIWHYGRQNVGVNAFIAIGDSGKAPNSVERWLITAGVVAGMFGILQILAVDVLPGDFNPFVRDLHRVGVYLYVVVTVAALLHLVANRQRFTVLGAASFLTCVFFFVPMYLTRGIDGLFLSYAIAHGCQYILFMGVTTAGLPATGDSARLKTVAVASMLLFACLIGWTTSSVMDWRQAEGANPPTPALDFLVGAVLGFTMSHFIVDAGAWRLSQKPQREFLGRKFAFLLAR